MVISVVTFIKISYEGETAKFGVSSSDAMRHMPQKFHGSLSRYNALTTFIARVWWGGGGWRRRLVVDFAWSGIYVRDIIKFII